MNTLRTRWAVVAVMTAAAWGLTACDAPPTVWTGEGPTATQYAGARHCGWESVSFIEIDREQYVYDPGSTIPRDFLAGEPEAHAVLPDDAVDTGLRKGGWELWLAADGQAAYIVTPDDVQKWPHAYEPILCS